MLKKCPQLTECPGMSVRATAIERAGARRVAAGARGAIALTGLVVLATNPALQPNRLAATIGMALILCCALSQLFTDGPRERTIEESVAAIGGVLINGLGQQRVTAVTLLWFAAMITGALVRGKVGRPAAAIFLVAMALPIVTVGGVTTEYLGLLIAAVALLLSGRVVLAARENLLELARYEADHDPLTDALSRAAFRAALDEMVAARDPDGAVSVAVLDLNDFGLVNKLRGHAAGDGVLVDTANAIRSVGGPGIVIGRLGGDEFAAAMPDAGATAFAERLLERLAKGEGERHSLVGAVGVAFAPRDGNSADGLLRASDVALRVAKHARRPKIAVYTGESFDPDGQGSAETALERLITGDGIEMVTQPIIEVKSGTVRSYEALARFRIGANSSPLHWFSVADEFERRADLERACLRKALQLLPELPADCDLSVNMSGNVLPEPETLAIFETVEDLSRLIIELTENTLIDDASLHAAIAILRGRQVKLSVDDMGAGYAGLRQMTAVHPEFLKLDRVLVAGIHLDPGRRALVRAIVDYVDHVGGYLVGEGVETVEELEALRDLGVHMAQGFLLSRPAPPWPGVAAVARPVPEPRASRRKASNGGAAARHVARS